MGARPTADGVRRFATALDGFVRHVTQGEYSLLDPDVEDIPGTLLDEARLLLASSSLSSDGVVQAIAATEVQRARALSHQDESGRVTAMRVLYARLSCRLTSLGHSRRTAPGSEARRPHRRA